MLLIRELIKDLENVAGDLIADYKTIPVVFGEKTPSQSFLAGYKVTSVGYLSNEIDLAKLYSAADIVIVPSRQESFSQVSLEAISCGTPVVAFDYSGPRDIIKHKVNGYLAKPYDPKDLVNGIEWIFDSLSKSNQLCLKAREIAIEKFNRDHMANLLVSIDERPVSQWACDGVLVATPTGSTAYAYSAGGPVVWPEVDALVLLPLAAHALFSKPMVFSPNSEIAIDLESDSADLNADGIRRTKLQKNDRIVLTSDKEDILLAHIKPATFTDRIVAKFKLPVEGWRGE